LTKIDSGGRATNGEARLAAKLRARGDVERHNAVVGLSGVHGHSGVELGGLVFWRRCTGAMGRERARGMSSEARECAEREKRG
jgi:hypothetical protein